MQHTKEPWNGKNIPLTASALERVGFYIVFTNNPATKDEAEANARRIVACVNAFAGISTENIEENKPLAEVLRWLNERIRMAEQQRDKLLAALKECLPYISEDREYNNAVAVIAEVKGQL